MTKKYKITTGFFAWIPTVFLTIVSFSFLSGIVISLLGFKVPFGEFLFFGIILPSFVIAGVLHIISLIIFLVIVLRNKIIDKEERMIWVIAMLFGGSAGQPAYWWKHIYKHKKKHES